MHLLVLAVMLACSGALYLLDGEGQRITDQREAVKQEKLEKQKEYEQSVDDFYANLQQKLDSYKADHAENIAISFYDIGSDKLLAANGTTAFDSISGSRIVLAIALADKLAEGTLDSSEKVYYDSTDYASGGGYISEHIEDKNSYTIDKLMTYMLEDADPIAANMLYRKLGGLTTVRNTINQTYGMKLNTTENKLTTNQGIDLLKILYSNKNKNSYYDKIISWMKDASPETLFYTEKTKGTLVHSAGTNAENTQDIGIFYTKHPFMLVVQAKDVDSAEEDISKLADEIYDQMINNYPEKAK